ncbi:PH domain-containing protein [Sphingomonas sp. 2R-10]|uniref:PH domain-containing protein n=1 Tax=Sphingomonas sp. 2R-10 TaxID=3045148 RepID=UPI000F7AD28F|nr:PH domain-containing protein [Sphingomonas sp. 2R-10]MDJ0275690.1 PH domain-containing protein [Sphingomonas sp. 2R-10]
MVSAPDAARRLHPGTIALRIIVKAPQNIAGIVALAAASSRGGLLVMAGVAALVLFAAAIFTWVRWRSFTYRLADGELVIADGILHRNRRSIPFERIQDVSIDQKLVARLFGLARVRIETGGGEADEATLDSVSLAEAGRLRAVLRGGTVAADEGGTSVPARATVFAMDARRVLVMGLFGFSLVWVGVLFAAINQLGDLIGLDWDGWRDWAGVARQEAIALATPLFAALAAIVALVLGAISGVARTFFVEHGFRLEQEGDRLRRMRGLTTRTEVVVGLRRIQLALIERGMVSGRLGWSGLRFQTLGGSDDVGGRQHVAPFARDDEVTRVLAAAGYPAFDPLPLRPVAFGHVVRAMLLRGVPPLIVIGIVSLFVPLAGFALLLVPIPVAAALLARRRHRYAILGDHLHVMRGVLAKRAWIVPLGRIQSVSVTRSPLQRLLGIATVRVDTAGAKGIGRPDIADLAVEDADPLARALLRER